MVIASVLTRSHRTSRYVLKLTRVKSARPEFGGSLPLKRMAQNCLFWVDFTTTSRVNANIFRWKVLQTNGKSFSTTNVPYTAQNLMNFGPQTGNNYMHDTWRAGAAITL